MRCVKQEKINHYLEQLSKLQEQQARDHVMLTNLKKNFSTFQNQSQYQLTSSATKEGPSKAEAGIIYLFF